MTTQNLGDRLPDRPFPHTTKALAQKIGKSEGYVRKLKSENPDRLIEWQHWQKTEDDRLFWSDEAVGAIEAILSNSQVPDNGEPLADEGFLSNAQVIDSGNLTLERLAEDFDRALVAHAQKIAQQRVARRLDRLVEIEEIRLMQRLVQEASTTDDLEPILDRWLNWHESTTKIRALAHTNGNGKPLALTGN